VSAAAREFSNEREKRETGGCGIKEARPGERLSLRTAYSILDSALYQSSKSRGFFLKKKPP
jgi:hypothetical protein